MTRNYEFSYYSLTCLKDLDSSFPHEFLNTSHFSSSNMPHTSSKLVLNLSRCFYFNQVTKLCNFSPPIGLNLSFTIKGNLRRIFWKHFQDNFSSSNHCSFHVLHVCLSNNYRSIDSLFFILLL